MARNRPEVRPDTLRKSFIAASHTTSGVRLVRITPTIRAPGAPAPFRVVLYRRMMVRIAEELARREGCWALATGDSLGQVASQTPDNLFVTEEAAELPLLRPLIGMDKIEITDQAQAIGTFETSIEPDQDCCTLFVPAHPSTRTRLETVRKIALSLAPAPRPTKE